MSRCKHERQRKFKVDDGGVFLRSLSWCRDCGAVRLGKKWVKPKK